MSFTQLAQPCFCDSQKIYKSCCYPFLYEQALPSHAVDLMRSRYTAYCLASQNPSDNLRFITYLLKTHVLDQGEALQESQDIQEFAKTTTFLKLEILDSKEKESNATVTFKISLQREGYPKEYVEKSTFSKTQEGKWIYLSSEFIS